MKIEEAVDKSSHNENVQRLRGYFLCSGFTTLSDAKKEINEWTLLYYSPRNKTIIDCFVNEKFITVGEGTPAMKDMADIPAHEKFQQKTKACMDNSYDNTRFVGNFV
ncbi:hypothetical protein HYZ41_02375 [archaeon]|nr:hypothetical protein [archaeon]